MSATENDGTGVNEVGRVKRALAYAWFETVMTATALLPDFTAVQLLRGRLLAPCFKKCGKNLMVGKGVTAAHPTSIELGNDVLIARGSWLLGFGGVRLGDEVMLGPYVMIVSALHTKENGSYRYGPVKAAPIAIERGAWMGGHSVIAPGVHIGEGALVAAGSLVTSDVPTGAKFRSAPGVTRTL